MTADDVAAALLGKLQDELDGRLPTELQRRRGVVPTVQLLFTPSDPADFLRFEVRFGSVAGNTATEVWTDASVAPADVVRENAELLADLAQNEAEDHGYTGQG